MNKSLVIFTILSCFLMVLTPMVSSFETRMVKDEIEDNIDDLFLKKGLLLDLFKNIYEIFTIKDIINIIFLILLFPIFYLIFYISIWGDWSYFDLITFIHLYFSILSALFENILEVIFGIDSFRK